MTTWKDGGNYGLLCREITDEKGDHAVCKVWTKRYESPRSVKPWPEGKANFRLILKAPQMLEALCSIRDMAECILQPLPVGCVAQVRWTRVRDQAVKAITMTQGENDEDELV